MCAKCQPYVKQIVSLLRNATIEYYNENKIFGCMDRNAYNFNPNVRLNIYRLRLLVRLWFRLYDC